MNKSSKLFLTIVTVLLLASSIQVECRRTYSSRSSSSGRGNRGKNQPSGGGLFGSWFGGSKSSGSGSSSGSISKPSASKKNWQTATSQVSSQPKTNWANPYYKSPSSAPLPSAPKEPNYGWKPATASHSSGSSFQSSNVGSRGYPVQSGTHQASPGTFGGYKPSGSVPSAAHYQTSQSNFGGYRPAAGVAPNVHATGYHPSTGYNTPGHQGSFGGYHPAPAHGVPHQAPAASYHPSAGHHASYPQQGSHGYQPSHGYSGYPAHSSLSGAAPTYQGTNLFGGSSGHYGYPGSGGWGLDTYGTRKSSGNGKLLTGLALGAAGGYLTSSLVSSISNPWKYSGYGYGSRYGYSHTPGYESVRSNDESAFERGYERGARDRNEKAKEAAPPAPQPEDPTSKWINCVAFDPQTQQTLINPNCSCTVTTSLDERTGQPISVHHCTTLNGLVMRPIPIQGVNSPPLPTSFSGPPPGDPNALPSGGVNSPGAVPSYGNAYQENSPYGAVPSYYLPTPTDSRSETSGQAAATETGTRDTKTEQSTTETKPEQSSAGSVIKAEVAEAEEAATADALTNGSPGGGADQSGNPGRISAPEELVGGQQRSRKATAEFYGQLQKIVNMGSFVDGG